MNWFKKLPWRWKLPILFTSLDLLYLAIVRFSFAGGHGFIIGEFFQVLFACWIPFFWHFPFAYILFGDSNLNHIFIEPVQTFFIFFLTGYWLEKSRNNLPKYIVLVFYVLATGVAILTAWSDRTREPIVMVLPNGYKGIICLKTKQSGEEEIKISNGQYRIEMPESGFRAVSNDFQGWHSYNAEYQDGTTIQYGDEYNTPVNLIAQYSFSSSANGNFYFIGNNLDAQVTRCAGTEVTGRDTGGLSNFPNTKFKEVSRRQESGAQFTMRKVEDCPIYGNLEFVQRKGDPKPIHYFTDDLDAKPVMGNLGQRIAVKNYEYPVGTPYTVWLVDLSKNTEFQIDQDISGDDQGNVEPTFSPDDNRILLTGIKKAYVVDSLNGKVLRQFAKDQIPQKWWQ